MGAQADEALVDCLTIPEQLDQTWAQLISTLIMSLHQLLQGHHPQGIEECCREHLFPHVKPLQGSEAGM